MSDKPFKSVAEQIHILNNDRDLTILNEEAAELALKRYGYYEIINGYKTPFLREPGNDEKGYKDDATFEHIYALYDLDRQIRNTVLQGIEQFEQYFKQVLAYTIAESISEDQERYTAKSHYNKGEARVKKNGAFNGTDRDKLLKKINYLLKSPKQPMKHYREKHKNVPPWILVKELTFGEAIFWYKLSRKGIREKIISRMFGIEKGVIGTIDPVLKIRQAFGDILSLCLDYRNLTAHGGRIYNHRSTKHALKWSVYIYNSNVINISRSRFLNKEMRSSLGCLIKVLSLFENRDPYLSITIWLSIHLDKYFEKYPNDKLMLEQEMELKREALPK